MSLIHKRDKWGYSIYTENNWVISEFREKLEFAVKHSFVSNARA